MAIPRTAPSGIFGSGFQPAAPQVVDYGQLIDAAMGGATSLVHGAYLRKVAERNAAIAQQERDQRTRQLEFEQQQATARAARETEKDKWEREKADRDFQLRERELEAKKREAGIVPPQQVVPPGGPIAPAGITLPERYDPAHDVSLQRGKALRAAPTYRTPAEIPGTPEHTAAVAADAEARAKAEAKYRRPASDGEAASQRAAIKSAIDVARAKYIRGTTDRVGRVTGAMSPKDANQKAIEDAAEIYGESAVREAIGKGVRLAPIVAPSSSRADAVRAIRIPTRAEIMGALNPTGSAAPAKAAPTPLAVPNRAAPTRAAPRATAPAGNEATMSDADLWELKRKAGMTAEQATAYVKARQRPGA